MLDATEVYGSICYFLMEFEKLNMISKKEIKAGHNTWKPPPADIYKIISDGAFDQKRRSGGWGFVVRDKSGEVLAAGAGNISYAASALHAEAIYRGILYASQLGMTRVIVETDSTVLAPSLKAKEVDRSAIGAMVRQI
jgi:hypothetical protein